MNVALEHTIRSMPTESTEQDLLSVWNMVALDLGLDAAKGTEILLTAARDATLHATGSLDPAWGGGWRWNLSEGVVKSICGSVLLAAVLSSLGVKGLAPLVIPAIIPLLFDLEKVQLERSEERVIRIIGARTGVLERYGKPERLYISLPESVRQSVTLEEFTIFLENAVSAGMVKKAGSEFEVLPDGVTVLAFTIQ